MKDVLNGMINLWSDGKLSDEFMTTFFIRLDFIIIGR